MKKLILFIPLLFMGCIHLEKTSYSRMDPPYKIEAIRNYLPQDVKIQPAYSIYEGSVWACNYKTEKGDSICCLNATVSMGQWKYCLLVDEQMNGFGFMELGTGEFTRWSEGKQPLFIKKEIP